MRAVKQAGLAVCCGGIIGMGESDEDVVDLALRAPRARRRLAAAELPAVDRRDAARGRRRRCAGDAALQALCLMRFTNPASDIRAAGGRERNLGGWQALALYPANSVFIEGYLTTPGLATLPTRHLGRVDGLHVVEGEVEVTDDCAAAHASSGPTPRLRVAVDHLGDARRLRLVLDLEAETDRRRSRRPRSARSRRASRAGAPATRRAPGSEGASC